MSEQNNATHSLAHSKWNCKYHIVFAPKYRNDKFTLLKTFMKKLVIGIL